MKTRQTGIAFRFVFAAATLIFAAVGCKDSNTITGNQPTPTPTPASGIAGSWTGTWTTPPSTHLGGCRSSINASAYFTFEGAKVTGAIDTGKLDDFVRCGLGRAIFHGSIEESSLNGTITGSVFAGLSYTGTAHGALSGTTLDIECVFTPTPENDPPYSGSLHLHR